MGLEMLLIPLRHEAGIWNIGAPSFDVLRGLILHIPPTVKLNITAFKDKRRDGGITSQGRGRQGHKAGSTFL